MGLKEKTVKLILMIVKIMTVKIILHVLMELTTIHAFAHQNTQVWRIENVMSSINVQIWKDHCTIIFIYQAILIQ